MNSATGATPGDPIAVSTLSHFLKDVVEGSLTPLWVRGEVTGFSAHRSGHWYFSLRDKTAQMKCVVWSRDVARSPATNSCG